jgi:hypothetical protein
MQFNRIHTLDELRHFLENALQLEHATLPPYLIALYSIRRDTNAAAWKILRMVAVEEMLHMTLVANVLNAIGGQPDVRGKDFIPTYPTFLPDGETEFKVSVQRFSDTAIDNFLKIEQPARPKEPVDLSKVSRSKASVLTYKRSKPLICETIGEFYEEILRAFEALYKEMGASLFSGSPSRQVPPQYFYSSGGKLLAVDGMEAVRRALDLISEQGEGYGGRIFDHEGELSHYYRFQQLKLKRLYVKGNGAGEPTGDPIEVDYSAVLPILENPTWADYPEGSDARTAATEFAAYYRRFLEVIQEAFNGNPGKLKEAMAYMFTIEQRMVAIMNTPIPGRDGLHATPIFSLPPNA